MIPDIYLNDSSMLSCGWLRESVDFPAPQPQMVLSNEVPT